MSTGQTGLLPSENPSGLEKVDHFNDVQDTPEDLARYSPTLPLAYCDDIRTEFAVYDKSALQHQQEHGKLVAKTAIWGTAAVLLAIIGLAFYDKLPTIPSGILLIAETVAALLAGLATLRGIRHEYKEGWLLQRYQAEQFRLLKYRFLLRPDIWKTGSEEQIRGWIGREIGEIKRLKKTAGLHEAVTEPSPHGPFEGVHARLSRREIGDLVQYYVEKRLGPQKEYLANRAQRNEFKDQIRVWLPRFFLVSLLAVFFKTVLELLAFTLESIAHRSDYSPQSALEAVSETHASSGLATAAHWVELLAIFGFAMIAALLPALAAGIRLRLSAGEFARNKSRFEAAHKALKKLEESILGDTLAIVGGGQSTPAVHVVHEQSFLTGSGFTQVRVRTEQSTDQEQLSRESEVDAYSVLRDLSWCEHILDAEHREWLRLMYDAEWFG